MMKTNTRYISILMTFQAVQIDTLGTTVVEPGGPIEFHGQFRLRAAGNSRNDARLVKLPHPLRRAMQPFPLHWNSSNGTIFVHL